MGDMSWRAALPILPAPRVIATIDLESSIAFIVLKPTPRL